MSPRRNGSRRSPPGCGPAYAERGRRPPPTRVLTSGEVTMDLDRHTVDVAGETVHLPLKQFRLLELLMSQAGHVVSTRSIIDAVWGELERVDRNAVQAQVARLRQALGDADCGRRLQAVPGIGYTWAR